MQKHRTLANIYSVNCNLDAVAVVVVVVDDDDDNDDINAKITFVPKMLYVLCISTTFQTTAILCS